MSEDEHRRFMGAAVRTALENVDAGHGGPFGAVVARGGEIVSRAGNRVLVDGDPTAHAEIVAIREACRKLGSFQLDGCDLYTSCEPCPMCMGAIYWARPDRVFFACDREDAAAIGFDDRFIYEELSRAPGERRIEMRRLAVEGAREALRAWREKEDRVPY